MLSEFELTGRTRDHICRLEDPACELHHDVAGPWRELRAAAGKQGIDLIAYSSFRDFDAQVRIWNDKYQGRRPLYDRDGTALDLSNLSEAELIDRILYWSALPGASRHHWGTDVDVIDGAAIDANYRVRLMPDEYASGGVFHPLQRWLDEHLEAFDFFRPYAKHQGGVSAEPWHISFRPVAAPALEALSTEALAGAIGGSAMHGKGVVLEQLSRLYARYVTNITAPDSA